MDVKKFYAFLICAYLTICGILIFNSGIFTKLQKTENWFGFAHHNGILTLASKATPPAGQSEIAPLPEKDISQSQITAVSGEQKTFTLGSVLPAKENPYKLQLTFTTKGAAISSARLRDYNNRDRKNPEPLELLSTIDSSNTMSSEKLLLPAIEKSFPLNKLNWQSSGVTRAHDESQSISFYATILNNGGEFIKLTKTYTLKPEDYLVQCSFSIANQSKEEIKAALDMLGPVGIAKEQERIDTRTITTGYWTPQGIVESEKISLTELVKRFANETTGWQGLIPKNADFKFLWTSISNKYFTAIVRPVPAEPNNLSPNWVFEKTAFEYNPDAIAGSGDENIGVKLGTENFSIAPASLQKYDIQLYIGPKDRHLFESNPLFNKLGFIQVIEFQACFGNVFRGLSFFILAVLDWLYQYIPNYGVVIIIFVFVIRIILHPITKRSQVSMMKMSKLAPKAEEIKQKYADNKTEMNKQLMELYKEHGASPMLLGCLPMFLQMPIWIALYSAIYAGIEFRGARFLPFWITDLSSVDAIFYFPAAIEKIPFIGSFIGTSFNLLPILLAIAMFAQQKLTPTSAPSTNPQAAQQQKIMMWMMPIMMLLVLYRAPSGLNLYIMSSTVAGVVEQYVIRKHIREKEALEEQGLVPTTSKMGGKLKKKKPKPPFRFS